MFKEVTHFSPEKLQELYQLRLLYDKCHDIDNPDEPPYYMSSDQYINLGTWDFARHRQGKRWSYYIQVEE